MNSVKISVIIPVHNVENYLEECLNSVANQTFKDIEIICIDDGSTDSSPDILNDYASKDDRFIVISQKNNHQGYSRKVGLDNAHGEFISFVDSDDFLEPDALANLYENITSNESDMVIFKFIRYDHINNSKSYDRPGFDFDSFLDEDFNNYVFNYEKVKRFVLNSSFAPWAKFYRKEFLDSYDDFFYSKDIYFEDVPFHVQVMLRAKLSFCPEFLYNYRVSNYKSVSNSIDDVSYDIFEIVDIVEKFLKENGYFNEFEKEFAIFKFTQIIQYLLKSKSEKYYLKAKTELSDIKLNFNMSMLDRTVYENLLSSDDYMDFYNNIVYNLNNNVGRLNNEVSKKSVMIDNLNNTIKDKDTVIKKELDQIKEKDDLIRENLQIIQNKDNIIENKDAQINENLQIIQNKDNIIRDKNIIIRDKDNVIENKDARINENLEIINQNVRNIEEKDRIIEEMHDDISYKNDIINQYSAEINSQTKELYRVNDLLRINNEEFAHVIEENGKLNDEVIKKTKDLDRIILDNENKAKLIKELENKNNSLIKEQDIIKNSNSWKITGPLRKVGNSLRKLK